MGRKTRVSRRTVCRGAVIGVAAIAVAACGTDRANDDGAQDRANLDDFRASLGQTFVAEQHTLTLVHAAPVRRKGANPRAFRLGFVSEGAASFEQGTYGVAHPRTGQVHMFLVPTAARFAGSGSRICVSAVFPVG